MKGDFATVDLSAKSIKDMKTFLEQSLQAPFKGKVNDVDESGTTCTVEFSAESSKSELGAKSTHLALPRAALWSVKIIRGASKTKNN